ncbi:MAG: alpha/beta hydrolase superfamily, partial [Chitinophagaceae bacterium]|nr:alpha/beta hydrolase superfamily [Chitinophagaceae bacterium]
MLFAFVLFSIVSFFIFLSFILDQFFLQYRKSDKQLRLFFNKYLVDAEIAYYSAYGRRLRYLSIENTGKPVLLFIHGSPSSLSFFREYYVDPLLLKYFHIIAIDRPGYGYSGFGKPLSSIRQQSEMMKALIDSLNVKKQPVIIFGESYGTSVACRMAMDFPGFFDGLILLGPSLAPGEEIVYKI